MKTIALIAMCLMLLSLGSVSYAQHEQHHPAAPGSSSPAMAPSSAGSMGAGPLGGMSDMMSMCMMMHPAIAVDADAVYVVRGDQVVKLSKDDLRVLASGTLPQPQGMAGMSGMSGGAATGKGPSGMAGMSGMSDMSGMSGSTAGSGPSMMTSRPEMEQMLQQLRQMQPSQSEESFLRNMIRHHQGAIDMSRLALTKATHPELRNFAQKTIDNQGREQQQFAAWLKDWYKVSADKQPMQIDAQMTSSLSNLSGRDFEIQFMQGMIAHHAEAVQMGRIEEQKAVHPEVRAAASKIVRQQSNEIAQLYKWLSSWYGIGAGSK